MELSYSSSKGCSSPIEGVTVINGHVKESLRSFIPVFCFPHIREEFISLQEYISFGFFFTLCIAAEGLQF